MNSCVAVGKGMHMEQKKSDTNRKYLRTQLTGQVFGNYILALMIYVAALFAILAIGWSVSMNISWQPSSIYYFLQWVKEWIIVIMLIFTSGGNRGSACIAGQSGKRNCRKQSAELCGSSNWNLYHIHLWNVCYAPDLTGI